MQCRPLRAEHPTPKCTLGCKHLDNVLRGGVPCGSITELVGRDGDFHAANGTQPHHLRYLYTEGTYAHRRLRHMADAFTARYAHHLPPGHVCEDNILVECAIHSPDRLVEVLHRVPQYLHRQGHLPLRLIIIDSIANIFRDGSEEAKGGTHYIDRATALFQVAATLKRLADEHALAVVTTNHVVDAIDGAAQASAARTTASMVLTSSGRHVVPALGLAWAACVSTRLFVARVRSQEAAAAGEGALRHLQVVFSPYLAPLGCWYMVGSDGVVGVVDVQDD